MVDQDNTHYRAIDEHLYTKDGKTLVQYAVGNSQHTCSTAPTTEKISARAFCGCTFLRRLELNENLNTIGFGAFFGCRNLRYIYILASVSRIGKNSFVNCISLECVEVDQANQLYHVEDGVLYSNNRLIAIWSRQQPPWAVFCFQITAVLAINFCGKLALYYLEHGANERGSCKVIRLFFYLKAIPKEIKDSLRRNIWPKNPLSVSSAIANFIKSGHIVEADAIGVPAVYNQSKALVMARGFLASSGLEVQCQPSFQGMEIDGKTKTAMRWTVRIKDNIDSPLA